MLDERIRIATGNREQTIYSPQDVVSCSKYSQGCDGGFPYLVAKYGQDYGIATEECFPYLSGVLTNVSCSAKFEFLARILTGQVQGCGWDSLHL
jgi:hypothetical protein